MESKKIESTIDSKKDNEEAGLTEWEKWLADDQEASPNEKIHDFIGQQEEIKKSIAALNKKIQDNFQTQVGYDKGIFNWHKVTDKVRASEHKEIKDLIEKKLSKFEGDSFLDELKDTIRETVDKIRTSEHKEIQDLIEKKLSKFEVDSFLD